MRSKTLWLALALAAGCSGSKSDAPVEAVGLVEAADLEPARGRGLADLHPACTQLQLAQPRRQPERGQ